MLEIILIVLLIFFLLGAVGSGPYMPYRQGAGWGAPSILWVLFVVILIILLFRWI